MSGVRKRLEKQFQLSFRTLNIYIKPWTKVKWKQVCTTFTEMVSFLFWKWTSSFICRYLRIGTQFLNIYLRRSNYEYLALSTVDRPKHGIRFNEQPITKRLLRAKFKQRAIFPHYTMTFTYHMMLSMFYIRLSISDFQGIISEILVNLVCLLSGQRS